MPGRNWSADKKRQWNEAIELGRLTFVQNVNGVRVPPRHRLDRQRKADARNLHKKNDQRPKKGHAPIKYKHFTTQCHDSLTLPIHEKLSMENLTPLAHAWTRYDPCTNSLVQVVPQQEQSYLNSSVEPLPDFPIIEAHNSAVRSRDTGETSQESIDTKSTIGTEPSSALMWGNTMVLSKGFQPPPEAGEAEYTFQSLAAQSHQQSHATPVTETTSDQNFIVIDRDSPTMTSRCTNNAMGVIPIEAARWSSVRVEHSLTGLNIPVYLEDAIRALKEFSSVHKAKVSTNYSSYRWLQSQDQIISRKQDQTLCSWRGYGRSYNGVEMLLLGQRARARQLLRLGMNLMLKACRQMSFRDVSNLLCICWFCIRSCPAEHRHELTNALQWMQQKATENGLTRRWYCVFALLNAALHIDPADTMSKIFLNRQLLDILQQTGKYDLDTEYELREQLVKLCMELQDFGAARVECETLCKVSLRMAGAHSDDTYRVRRFRGRVYLKEALYYRSIEEYDVADEALINAEFEFRSLLNDFDVYRHLFRPSAAKKEWTPWEDLKTIAILRGKDDMGDYYFEQSLKVSADMYDHNSANTARILKEYLDKLEKEQRWQDIYNMQRLYPEAFKIVKTPPED